MTNDRTDSDTHLAKSAGDDNLDTRDWSRKDGRLSESFFELTKYLRRNYDIDKGVLVLIDDGGHRLSAISTWHDGLSRDGLSLNLPADSSLFEKVIEHGQVYTEDFCGAFSGNFFERKLLLDDDSRSFVLQPLKSEGRVLGLLGYSSHRPTAFAMCNEGTFDEVAARFGAMIERKVYDQ